MAKLLGISIRPRVTCIAFIILGNFQNWNMWSLGDQTNPVCTTPECQKLADIYKKNMNPNGKPCTDFHDYVCKGWLAQNPRPPSAELWTVDQAMEHGTMHNLKILLEDQKVDKFAEFETAKNLYKACRNLPYLERLNSVTIKSIMSGISNFPILLPNNKVHDYLSWSAVENSYIKETGESAFLEYNLIAEAGPSKNFPLKLRHLISPHGTVMLLVPWISKQDRKQYKVFLTKLIVSLAPNNLLISNEALDRDLEEVIDFRDDLNEIIDDEEMDQTYEEMTITQLQEWYNKEAKGVESAKIHWLDKIRAMYKNGKDPNGLPINDLVKVQVQKSYFSKLAALLRVTPRTVILNHIHLYFAERHLKFSPELEKQLNNLIFKTQEQYIEIRPDTERWQWCIANHNMRATLGRLYIRGFFPDSVKQEVELMFDEAKDIIELQINASNWLDASTKFKSCSKVDFTTCQIGHPAWYSQHSQAKRDSRDIDPLEPTAYFVQDTNTFYASAAYLQTPLYNRNTPYVINYGSTFSLIGHELYHAFGHKGLKHDILGENRIWWPREMYNQFLEQSKCFDDQYNQYRDKVIKKLNGPKLSRDDLPSTVDEDISDVMGLKLAYDAFKRKLREKKNVCPTLPGFEKTSCEKLFFIAFGNAFCSGLTPADEAQVIEIDKHSLPKIRVNGAVANMKEFSDAFGCSAKDPLRLAKPCDIWKK